MAKKRGNPSFSKKHGGTDEDVAQRIKITKAAFAQLRPV